MVIWWSGLYVCVADGFNFNQSGPALDGHEELETASLRWKSLDIDCVLIYLFKTCKGTARGGASEYSVGRSIATHNAPC